MKQKLVLNTYLKVNSLDGVATDYVNQHIAHSMQVWFCSSERERLNAKSSPLSSFEFPLESPEVAS